MPRATLAELRKFQKDHHLEHVDLKELWIKLRGNHGKAIKQFGFPATCKSRCGMIRPTCQIEEIGNGTTVLRTVSCCGTSHKPDHADVRKVTFQLVQINAQRRQATNAKLLS